MRPSPARERGAGVLEELTTWEHGERPGVLEDIVGHRGVTVPPWRESDRVRECSRMSLERRVRAKIELGAIRLGSQPTIGGKRIDGRVDPEELEGRPHDRCEGLLRWNEISGGGRRMS